MLAILCQQSKMQYYDRLVTEPLPVESKLDEYTLGDILNTEIAQRKITTVSDTTSLLTWTYLYRRLPLNPNYYKIIDRNEEAISAYLSEVADNCLLSLSEMQVFCFFFYLN
jgi:pre-mRNA-splicing helicase BRR2